MNRTGSLWTTAIAGLFFIFLAPRGVEAGGNTPIYAAASDYREAVRDFERVVLRTPKIRSSVERLVDDLEDSTSDLKSAARDPARFDRLVGRFVTTDALHARVELTFFGDPLYPPEPQLEESWLAVYEAYGRLVYEIRYLQQLRSAKRGHPVAIVDHRFDPQPAATWGPGVGAATPGDRYTAPGLGLGTRGPTVYGPSVSGPSVYGPRVSGPSVTRGGAQLERSPRTSSPTRRIITTPDELRSAILGALLQRQR
ncbi:hypothetical protein [Stieleria neptunia]|uniref:hypothetical protein n=1 Tax=Stieleria neptunia TaxID=2527979 RepID=UPI001E4966C0|nr:hypothetical protein [Stieleria neptunia]